MFPNNSLSSTAVFSPYFDAARQANELLVDYERGGVGLNNGSQGLSVQIWTIRVLNSESGQRVQVSAPNTLPVTLFTDPTSTIEEVALAFDQNMNPFVAYIQDGVAKFWWYDSTLPGMTTTTLPAGSRSVRCCIDDRRQFNIASSDIVLTYIRDGSLYFRLQRDRYLVEYLLGTGFGAEAVIIDIGMNKGLRLQWRLRGLPPDNTAFVPANPYLGDVVESLCRQGGIGPEELDTTELFDDEVVGLPVILEQGLDKPIEWLREMYFFDAAEYDKKLRFPKRGRGIVARIPYTDLVQQKETAIKVEEEDVSKLPRKVHINHQDPDAGHAPNKQTAQRRTNLELSREEKKIETRVVATADFVASAALTKLKQYWNEPRTYTFSTTRTYAHLTVTDVIEVEDSEGNWHRVSLREKNEDGHVIEWEAKLDGGTRTYGTQVYGNALPPPTSTTPGLVGETTFEILNIPCLKDEHDEPGLYMVGCGQNSAWRGYQLLYSTDGGTSYNEAFTTQLPGLIGETETDLSDEVSAEYPGHQKLTVLVNYPLQSVNDVQLQEGQNRAVVGDELIQFKTATLIGMVGAKYQYELSYILRGRKNTTIEFWPLGTRFVFLDGAVTFVPSERWHVGLDLMFKPVSVGHTEDETLPLAYLFDECWTQKEWPPHSVEATRDVSNNVSVTFVGRGRLGVGTNPYHSKYFRGYRVKFSDGFSADTYDQFYTRASTPAAVTITVCALNDITGEGPLSEGVTV